MASESLDDNLSTYTANIMLVYPSLSDVVRLGLPKAPFLGKRVSGRRVDICCGNGCFWRNA
jgi:hypothetical protein